jgi:NAD(P)-dependent dehydrogenase (short-subunit alcohol dehydrogenase family)
VRRRAGGDTGAAYAGAAAAVTGGASGIGRALVEGLVARGARVLAVDLDGDALASLAAEVPGVETLRLDVTDADAPRRLIDAALERLGGLDIVFANAGIVWGAPFLSMSDADIDRLVEVNYTSQVRLTRALLPFFAERGKGVIAYTGSLSAHVYSPMHSVYTGTKGALHGFVAAVRRELRRELPPGASVQLTVIQPNFTRTNLVEQELWDELEKKYPVRSAAEVAEAALRGVARGDREVIVNVTDHVFKWLERIAPPVMDAVFQWGMTDQLVEKAAELATGGRGEEAARGAAAEEAV